MSSTGIRMSTSVKTRKMLTCVVFGLPEEMSETVLPTYESIMEYYLLVKHEMKATTTTTFVYSLNPIRKTSIPHPYTVFFKIILSPLFFATASIPIRFEPRIHPPVEQENRETKTLTRLRRSQLSYCRDARANRHQNLSEGRRDS